MEQLNYTTDVTVDSVYDKLSKERKEHQRLGLLPDWYSTGGFQAFKKKYLYGTDSFKGQVTRIAKTAARHSPDPEYYEKRFFQMLWDGWLSPSTPVLANMGTDRGMPVSCSGSYVDDSVAGFYETAAEIAVLSKNGFGTSGYLGDVRPRGSLISKGGKADGVIPVIKLLTSTCDHISQGNSRRGSGAWYIPMDHGDFWEVLGYLEANPDSLNIGWNIHDSFLEKLINGDEEATHRWQASLRVKMTLGKGYYCFPDKINRARPEAYVKNNLKFKAGNLCNEVHLASDQDNTYTCVLASMNVALYDQWKDTTAVQDAIVFLDCVCSEFIEKATGIKHLEKAVNFTRNGRALGLGQMGLFSLFQKRMIAPDGFEAHMLNHEIAKYIREEAEKATKMLAEKLGEPLWCKGLGRRNTHLLAIAPTKTTALLMGGWSEGINPDPAMAFSTSGAAGDIDRVNPVLLELMKSRGAFTKKSIREILDAGGSVQGVNWLNEDEKKVFKTAFEIDQSVLIRYAAVRQKYVDQGQSVNLFFAADDTEEYIAKVHQEAFLNEMIYGLYYVYSTTSIKAARTGECEACQ